MKRKTIILAVVAAAAMAIAMVGCGVKITNIAVPDAVTVEKGETVVLPVAFGTDDAPAVTPETAATGESAETDEKVAKAAEKLTIEWTSSDESVATVDETGTVTAVAAGEADVTASVKDADIAASTHIKVVVTPTSVVAPESIDLVTNGENTKDLDAKLVPADATDVKLAYESSDESVATVDETGKVTAVANGECTITTYVVADAKDADASELSAAVVEAADAEEIDDSVATMPEDLMDSAFGVVPENLKAETKVTVTTNVEGITLDKTEGVLTVGNTVTVTATVTPDTATNASVTWSSSDEAIATVDSEGKITAVAPGTATITATSDSNPDANATYAVTVQAKKVAAPASTKTSSKSSSSNAGNSSNGGAAAAAPSNPVPAPDPAPAQPSEPAPAPDPQPEQPSNGDNGGSGDSGNSGDKYGEGYDRWGGPVNSAPTDNGCTQEEIDAGGC
jgi:uncharacterized protein YjdB